MKNLGSGDAHVYLIGSLFGFVLVFFHEFIFRFALLIATGVVTGSLVCGLFYLILRLFVGENKAAKPAFLIGTLTLLVITIIVPLKIGFSNLIHFY